MVKHQKSNAHMAIEEIQLSQHLARQTSYALLTAVETDLRTIIYNIPNQEDEIANLLGDEIYAKAVSRSERDRHSTADKLIDFVDFGESIAIINRNKSQIESQIANFLRKSTVKLEKLIPIRNRVMHSRPLEFEDYPYVIETCRYLLSSKPSLFANLRYLYDQIRSDPTTVLNLEIESPFSDDEASSMHNLPVPDFDDTGFLGRNEQVQEIKRLIYSNWPVVTIVGEGGIGKTALAVKLAYDILDDQDNPFDAIIWSSSKTTSLTENDVVEIDGAIKDSVGLFNIIDEQFNSSEIDPTENILDYLNVFKILLILDNLETVLDNKIRNFISKIRSSSKVLITSRIGLGELETRYQLDPLTTKDSIKLLRTTAKSRRMFSLANAKQSELAKYCGRMYGNPAFIKWFVSAVQSGRRPETVIAKPDKFLDFCMSNVIDYLDEGAKSLVEIFLIYPGTHSPPVLAHLADLSSDELQFPLQQLLITNILQLSIINVDDRAIASYEIADLPRAYLVKNYKPTPERAKAVIQRKVELINAQERFGSEKSNKYVLQTIALRSRDDAVAARYLSSALSATYKGKWEQAQHDTDQAKGLAPDFFEVYRVEGFIHGQCGNYPQAQQCYLTAIELESRSAPLRYWYAGFLLRHMNDAEGAEKELRTAHNIDGDSCEILNELSRSLTYQHKYAEAEECTINILSKDGNSTKTLRIAYDGLVQIYTRGAQFELGNKDYSAALDNVKKLVGVIKKMPRDIVDQKIVSSIEKGTFVKPQLLHLFDGTNRVEEIARFLVRRNTTKSNNLIVAGGTPIVKHVAGSADDLMKGRVKNVLLERIFGFVSGFDGLDYFFHRSSVDESVGFAGLREGDLVKFHPSASDRGPIAFIVSVASRDEKEQFGGDSNIPNIGDERFGKIISVVANKGYCFIADDYGFSFFAHVSSFEESNKMNRFYEEELLLKFIVQEDEQGRRRAENIVNLDRKKSRNGLISGVRYTGTVKKKESTFGFTTNEESDDIFLHQTDFLDGSEWEICFVGSDVEFEIFIEEDDERMRAINIKLTSKILE